MLKHISNDGFSSLGEQSPNLGTVTGSAFFHCFGNNLRKLVVSVSYRIFPARENFKPIYRHFTVLASQFRFVLRQLRSNLQFLELLRQLVSNDHNMVATPTAIGFF